MNYIECTNRHLYDTDKYNICPYCERERIAELIPQKFKELGEINFIGQGSTCHVFKIDGKTEYALKIIECNEDESKYFNALYELEIMKSLSEKNHIVNLIDYDIVKEDKKRTVYLLEKYYMTMSDFLNIKTADIFDIVKIVIGICEALSECRNAEVLHLDIQPKNIYIDNINSVRLGDFGSSMFEKDISENNSMRGTLAFIAPEVYNEGKCSEQSDIYSVGLILYSLLNKRTLPFMDVFDKDKAIHKRLMGISFPKISILNAEISEKINSIIKKACAYHCSDRFKSADEFKAELTEFLKFAEKNPQERISNIGESEFKKVLPLVYVLQTSGGMNGSALRELNAAVEKTARLIENMAVEENIDVKVSILTFGGYHAKWTIRNQDIADVRNLSFEALGHSDMDMALRTLNEGFAYNRHNENGIILRNSYLPIVIFISNGYIYNYKMGLDLLNKNSFYRRATKIGIMVGEFYDEKNVSEIVGNSEAVLKKVDMDLLSKFFDFKWVSASLMASRFDADRVALSLPARRSITDKKTLSSEVCDSNLDNEDLNSGFNNLQFWDGGDWDDEAWDNNTTKANSNLHFDADSLATSVMIFPRKIKNNNSAIFCGMCGNQINQNDNFCRYCGYKIPKDSPLEMQKVEFSTIVPQKLVKGEYFSVNLVMYEKEFRDMVDEMINDTTAPSKEHKWGVFKINEGAEIKVVLYSNNIDIEDNQDVRIWNGGYQKFSFNIFLPKDYEKNTISFKATLYINKIVVASKLDFKVDCLSDKEQKIYVDRKDIHSAFISYASKDRKYVTTVVQGMRTIGKDMDFFIDIMRLNTGSKWEPSLYREIDQRDVMYLFWSRNAKESEWVNKEWKYAFDTKGEDFIEPVPIEQPDLCPPPEELKHKHFNDEILYIIKNT